MSAQPTDRPLAWNVAGLLGDDVGAARTYDVADALIELPDLVLAEADRRTGPADTHQSRDLRRRSAHHVARR